jgi:hypothetical protein
MVQGSSASSRPFGTQIENVVRADQDVEPARVGRIGVEDRTVPILVERADAGGFLAREISHLVVVVNLALGRFILREGHVMIAVEVPSVGGHPPEAPAHALPEGLKLGKGRSRDDDHGDVAGGKVRDHAIEMVGDERAVPAAFPPARAEHEVIDDELAAPVEELGERLPAAWRVESIRLLDAWAPPFAA